MIFKPGEEICAEFPCKIVQRLAGGSMAELYLANVKNTPHMVGIKGLGAQETQIKKEALSKEASVLNKLRHEKIPQFFGFFEEENRIYYVMSYQEGACLEQLVRRKCSLVLPEERVCNIALQLCGILAYIHKKEVVHGDIKPANLLLSEYGDLTLLDFGTAVFGGEHMKTDSDKSKYRFQGTLGFAAPECWHGGRVHLTPETDIFALGATLFYLLEGREPRECFGNFVLSEENQEKKNRWQPVLNKCCAMEASKRYHSAAEVYKDIKQIYTTLAM